MAARRAAVGALRAFSTPMTSASNVTVASLSTMTMSSMMPRHLLLHTSAPSSSLSTSSSSPPSQPLFTPAVPELVHHRTRHTIYTYTRQRFDWEMKKMRRAYQKEVAQEEAATEAEIKRQIALILRRNFVRARAREQAKRLVEIELARAAVVRKAEKAIRAEAKRHNRLELEAKRDAERIHQMRVLAEERSQWIREPKDLTLLHFFSNKQEPHGWFCDDPNATPPQTLKEMRRARQQAQFPIDHAKARFTWPTDAPINLDKLTKLIKDTPRE